LAEVPGAISGTGAFAFTLKLNIITSPAAIVVESGIYEIALTVVFVVRVRGVAALYRVPVVTVGMVPLVVYRMFAPVVVEESETVYGPIAACFGASLARGPFSERSSFRSFRSPFPVADGHRSRIGKVRYRAQIRFAVIDQSPSIRFITYAGETRNRSVRLTIFCTGEKVFRVAVTESVVYGYAAPQSRVIFRAAGILEEIKIDGIVSRND
jgi:hypothetical protein